MTNAEIISRAARDLMAQGVLAGSGIFAETADGSTVELPEEIHTFGGWKEMGYKVKKGEHAVAKFPIWKHKTYNKKDADGNDTGKTGSKMFMVTSAFFKGSQVERGD